MTHLPFPLAGSTLITGPSNVGKTRLTARALHAWLIDHGPTGVVIFEFGPEFRHEGRILGRHLARFESIPDAVWVGEIDAHAPRAAGTTIEESVQLAAENARRAAQVLAAAPHDPQAVFVNDATIAFQHETSDLGAFTGYWDQAECVVVNAFESDELGTTDPISQQEQAALDALKHWANRIVTLEST